MDEAMSLDENEEFELQYQDELELMENMPLSEEEIPIQRTKTTANIHNSTGHAANDVNVFGSQLSQINNDQADSNVGSAVNRCLFGLPQSSSTLRTQERGLAPIQEVICLSPKEMHITDDQISNEALKVLNTEDLRGKRRWERELFGDIDDLNCDNTYEDPVVKKARTDEERDFDLIAKILDARRNNIDITKPCRNDSREQLQAMHDFKMKNLSYTVPKWPFLSVRQSAENRVYVRFHSEEYEARALNEILVAPKFGSLLGERKSAVWADANDIVLKRINSSEIVVETAPVTPVMSNETLWVDKYKPRKYIDLLSDEGSNRSLLYWLKMWDKMVFGREPKIKVEDTSKLNTFNKSTGKFESTGGWRQRKVPQKLNTNVDDLGRPMQKVALLCGAPGIGKTTLAHTLARHAGYDVREVNASDDRSPEAFRSALENGTQMSSVIANHRRPNCIILDEIDGAPKQSIEFLVKFVSDGIVNKTKTKGDRRSRNILKRPIICICNDLYDPALRPLRQIAFVITFPPIDSARLADRLLQIAKNEHIRTDFGALFALAEKSGNDVRSSISTMEFFNAQKNNFTLTDVLNHKLGHKDRHQGLFDVWRAIFSIKRPKTELEQNGAKECHVSTPDMTLSRRVQNVLDVAHGCGDYEKIFQGVYENFLEQKMPDPNLDGVVEALQWFCFTDRLQRQINQQQNYTTYPYLQFGFVIWHLLFATAWPKIAFPRQGYEFYQKTTMQQNIFKALRRSISCGAIGVGQGHTVLVDTVPLVKRILSPKLRAVALQLLTPKEQYDLQHTVAVMVDLGVKYIQVKSAELNNVYQMEPDLEALAQFPNFPNVTLTYFGRQLIAREVELEIVRSATPKTVGREQKAPATKNAATATKQLPNHLRSLQPKKIQSNATEMVTKDFFGRIQKMATATTQDAARNTDAIVKSPIWFRYKEGFNNAVRKDIHLNELL